MFMVSFRLTWKRALVGLLAVCLVVGLGVMGVSALRGNSVETSTQATSESGKKNNKKIPVKTAEQRLEFIRSFGWEVQEEPAEIMEVVIPKEFDEVYEAYNAMQKQQGYDLEKYAGKRCKRYSYIVTNYPDAPGEVRVNILACDDKVVGGDVCTLDAGGFMHGFALQ